MYICINVFMYIYMYIYVSIGQTRAVGFKPSHQKSSIYPVSRTTISPENNSLRPQFSGELVMLETRLKQRQFDTTVSRGSRNDSQTLQFLGKSSCPRRLSESFISIVHFWWVVGGRAITFCTECICQSVLEPPPPQKKNRQLNI